MSNKSLFITLITVIVVVVAAVVAYGIYQKNHTVSGTGQSANQAPAGSTDLTAASPISTPVAGTCVNNFNSTTLAKNSNMDIHNKFVIIDVKNFGAIKVQLYDQDAPKAVENFLRLTDSGYYNCLTFHRIAQGFVIQGGDPSGNGTGGKSAFGAPFADELNANTPSYKAGYVKGVLAMANSGPNTNGSQFFIMLADNDLPHLYTIFGKVVSGQDVVDKIGQQSITPVMGPTDGSPVTPIIMESLKITSN